MGCTPCGPEHLGYLVWNLKNLALQQEFFYQTRLKKYVNYIYEEHAFLSFREGFFLGGEEESQMQIEISPIDTNLSTSPLLLHHGT